MAEIKVEKKKPVWPWILLGLIILGIILYFVFADDDNEIDDMEDNTEQIQDSIMTPTDTEATDTYEVNDVDNESVSNYIAHVGDETRMGIDHEYTNTALIHLINAVDAKARELNIDVNADLQEIRNDANQITEDPMSDSHANTIKDVGTKLANVMERLQSERFPNLSADVEQVKTAANNIDGAVLTLEQKDQVNMFFQEAADVLRQMS